MSSQSAAWWRKARRARDQLIARLGTHPAVTNIDIGLLDPPQAGVIGGVSVIFLRVGERGRNRGGTDGSKRSER